MRANVLIRAIGEHEREAWYPLWAGYLTFYKASIPRETSDTAWERFHDSSEPMFALGAYVDDRLSGFAHYLFHRSTWARNRYCYLEDLFVADSMRGLGLGRALIEEVYRKAESAGASRVYWLTQSNNTQARALYDKVADNLGFIQYRKVL
jgi:GNAT superfamily N-acetyltransferase